jgi:predicted DNA-binding antitoxin AbrB/MazE fold protein
METERLVVNGTIRGGVIIPETDVRLPEGTHVKIVIDAPTIPPELQSEFDAWARVGDEAWGLIDEWEKEEQP